jgi:hypothetical protein
MRRAGLNVQNTGRPASQKEQSRVLQAQPGLLTNIRIWHSTEVADSAWILLMSAQERTLYRAAHACC